MTETLRLTVSCPDRRGIVAAVTAFLLAAEANVIELDQFSSDDGEFFLRMVFTMPGDAAAAASRFGPEVAERFGMNWRLTSATHPKRIAVLVSREDHCLQELLWRWRRDELAGEVVLVASNHADHADTAAHYGLPYHHVPVLRPAGKPAAEETMLKLLDGRCELVVLARYMQILSGDFLTRVGVPVINIHHSFLPAFVGAEPYRQAKERGVKLIGATAHYVTEELDAGPIIEQDVIRVGHDHNVATLARLGADIERTVLARAVRWHCEDRILRHGSSTVIF